MSQDVAVLLLVSATDGSRLADGLAALRAARSDLEVVIVADEDAREDLIAGLDCVENVPVIGVGSLSDGREALAWNAVTRPVSASVITAIPLTALKSSTDVRGALAEAAADAPAGRHHEPTLVPHPGTPRWVVASYVREVLRAPAEDPARLAHAGRLAMASARLVAEAVDPLGNQVRITARVSMPHGLQQQPPWQFRLGVHCPGGASAWSPPTALRPRTDWAGRGRWERLVAEVPLDQLPTGDYELMVELVGDPHLRPRALRPSVGSVTPGRTRKMTWTVRGHQGSTRYLPFSTGSARVAGLEVQQDAHGRRAAGAWWLRRLRQDLGFVARGKGGRRWRLLLLIRTLTRPLFFGRQIWIVGERRDTAQDNGLHFFRFVRRSHPQRHVYYVIERDSPEYRKIRRLGHVVAHSSWRHQLLMLHADVLANAFSVRYLIPRSWERSGYSYQLAWRIGALRVFLQHGVHISPAALQRMTTGYDIVITSATRETQALRQVSGYDEQLVETGLPRYDALAPGPSSRTVLLVTTWRRYLPSRVFAGQGRKADSFDGSAYQRFTSGLLQSMRLHQILERHDHRLVFLPHHNLADQFHQVRPASDRVQVLEPTGDDIQRLVRTCDVFVTDHSSVHFDAAYLGKPVIYARFDREEYESRHAAPSWFDFERDGYGPVTETLDETLDELERVLSTGCLQQQVYRERIERLLTHHDQHNAQRLLDVIEARLEQRTDELR
jgi:CDP-glycerol glycerophosphotransferase (TagB/SpsB family)